MVLVKKHHQTQLFSASQEQLSHSVENSRTSLKHPGNKVKGSPPTVLVLRMMVMVMKMMEDSLVDWLKV